MRLKFIICSVLILSTFNSIAQNFQDYPSNETDGDFPSKWNLLQGSAEIMTIEGVKAINLSHKAIISPILESKSYLSDNFTLEFEAYFTELEQAVYYYQYYTIRFWDGSGNYVKQPDDGDIITYQPLKIQRNGVRLIGHKSNREITSHENFKKQLESIEAAWKLITISYKHGMLKVSIDGNQILNIPKLNYKPSMISIGSHYNSSNDGFLRGIKNVNISGIQIGINNNNSITVAENTDTTTQTENYSYKLPEQDGNPNQILQTNGNGNVSWIDIPVKDSTPSTAGNEILIPNSYGAPGQILQTDGNGTVNWVDFPSIEPAPHTHETTEGDNTNEENTNPETTNTSTGLEAFDEGNGIGWRLKGRDLIYYANIGFNAIDLSYTAGSSAQATDLGASGKMSFAMGNLVYAKGEYSLAMGVMSGATGDYSMAFGNNARSMGNGSIAMGVEPLALKDYTTAIGHKVRADGIGAVALGEESKALKDNATAIGHNVIADGISAVAMGEVTKATGDYSLALGLESEASGRSALAIGEKTTASGKYSTSIGLESIASGISSTSLGYRANAVGHYSTALGHQVNAIGKFSATLGILSKAEGDYSMALGHATRAESYNSTVLGMYNIGGGDPLIWKAKDPLFEIGNGNYTVSSGTRFSNALTILKNGNTGIGTHQPRVKLHITGGADASLSTGGYMIIGNKQGENIVFDNNEIMARNNVQSSTLFLQHNGGDVFVGGSVVHSSDRRFKQDITNLPYGLKEVLQLRPVSYLWKSRPEASQKSMGLIAQEVQPIIEEIITINTEHNNTLGVNYTELIPILIKAIQEQQKIIETQKKEIENLSANSSNKDEALISLTQRLEQIETILNNKKL